MATSVETLSSSSRADSAPQRPTFVRITHWINALSFFGLLISGIAILIAHPRLYWGETGSVETASLIDLPLPFVLKGQNGWGRYLHFLSVWVCAFNSLFYVASGVITGHFRTSLVPSKSDLTWSSFTAVFSELRGGKRDGIQDLSYNVHQRLAYLGVVFLLLPLLIWTGLAMSPAFVSVFPATVELLGGYQSARTIHFFVATALVVEPQEVVHG